MKIKTFVQTQHFLPHNFLRFPKTKYTILPRSRKLHVIINNSRYTQIYFKKTSQYKPIVNWLWIFLRTRHLRHGVYPLLWTIVVDKVPQQFPRVQLLTVSAIKDRDVKAVGGPSQDDVAGAVDEGDTPARLGLKQSVLINQ